MATEQSDDQKSQDAAPEPERRPWSPPELIQYGSFRKLTQSKSGSTGESGNFTMKSCL